MKRGLGSRPDAPDRMIPISKPLPKRAAGVYPRKGTGAGEYGSTAYPTVIESYNRDSDYKRWRLGQEYYFGTGRSWADFSIHTLARFVTGAVDGTSKEIVSLFPSTTSPERAWYAGVRTRGSIILPQPLREEDITLNTSDPDVANHTLTWRVSGILTPGQVAVFGIFVGDQFEDSAIGPQYPTDLVQRDVGSVALTLVAANPGTMTLVFDLSRPHGRIERNGRVYWDKLPYSPMEPVTWRPGRYLCSSFKFFCCCPDHLGGAVANLEIPSAGQRRDLFPMPSAARSAQSPWEQQGAGYYRQWRTLPRRRDERRDCKHIHAFRWRCGVPWLEPSDYPTGDSRDFLEFAAQAERRLYSEEIMEYFRLRRLSWDRYILTVADTVGLILFPDGDPRDSIRPDPRPMLWNDSNQPLVEWCRQNDWWLERGTQTLRVFNQGINGFETTVTIAGNSFPVLQVVDPDAPGAPVIIR